MVEAPDPGKKSKVADTPDEDPRSHSRNDELDANQLAFERDLALRQARLAEAGLKVVRMALNENRPLEALFTVNNELDRLDEELGGLEQLGEARDDA